MTTAGNLLRAEDVAAVLAISKGMVYKLANSGDLPSVRIGKSLRFRREDVDALISREAAS